MVGSGSETGKFDLIRQKGPDTIGSGSAKLKTGNLEYCALSGRLISPSTHIYCTKFFTPKHFLGYLNH